MRVAADDSTPTIPIALANMWALFFAFQAGFAMNFSWAMQDIAFVESIAWAQTSLRN